MLIYVISHHILWCTVLVCMWNSKQWECRRCIWQWFLWEAESIQTTMTLTCILVNTAAAAMHLQNVNRSVHSVASFYCTVYMAVNSQAYTP